MFSHHTFHRLTLHRTLFIGVCFLSLLLGCGSPAPKVYHVGVMSGLDYFAGSLDGFKAKMTELGYVEGKNIVYDVQRTNVDPPKEAAILKKFVDDKVDLIFSFPTEVSIAAKAATKGSNVPVVFADAVTEGTNLVDSVPQPGGNITGVRFPGQALAVKRLEILHELAPNAKRIWVTFLKGYPIVEPELQVLRPAAASMGLTLIEVPATGIPDIQADLDAREKAADIGIDAMLIIPEPLTVSIEPFAVFAKFAARHDIPVGGADLNTGEYRSLFGLVPDSVAVGKQAALLADKIFKGTPAGTIPVVTPENVFVINYRVAQGLGLNVNDGLLQMANQVIR